MKRYIKKQDYLYLALTVALFVLACVWSVQMDKAKEEKGRQVIISQTELKAPFIQEQAQALVVDEPEVEQAGELEESQDEIEPVELESSQQSDVVLAGEPKNEVLNDDIDLLARLIACEMGCSWIADEQQLYVGSVVLNRVASSLFPNTLREVIYQPGQYEPAISGWLETVVPDERTRENARWLLENGSILPEGVLYQSTVSQGPIYATYYDEILGTTTYYCYGS